MNNVIKVPGCINANKDTGIKVAENITIKQLIELFDGADSITIILKDGKLEAINYSK